MRIEMMQFQIVLGMISKVTRHTSELRHGVKVGPGPRDPGHGTPFKV